MENRFVACCKFATLEVRWMTLIAAAFLAVIPKLLLAGATSASWVVVVNGASQNSRTIANHWIHLRNLPARNVIVLQNIPATETIDRKQFVELILQPLFEQLKVRGLESHVQGVAYSCDFPTKIVFPNVDATVTPNAQYLTSVASLNGATYLYQIVQSPNVTPIAFYNNHYSRIPVSQATQLPIPADMQAELQQQAAAAKLAAEQAEAAKAEAENPPSEVARSGNEPSDAPEPSNNPAAPKAIAPTDAVPAVADITNSPATPFDESAFLANYLQRFPYQTVAWVRLAEIAIQAGDEKRALEMLGKAAEFGWSYASLLRKNPAFESLRNSAKFQTILVAMEDAPIDWTEPRGFDARNFYTVNGIETRDQRSGIRYMLSTVLAATQPLGNTMDQAIDCLHRAAAADFTQPKGTFFFTLTDDVRTTCRASLFPVAIAKLKQHGFEAVQIKREFPIREKRVAGITMGSAGFSWAASGSTLLPGAIGDNLTSVGGDFENAGQTKLSEYLANGAAGASGAVYEPYSLQQKFPLPMIHETYARGATLAEAFYQSLLGPYQLLIVGDPLCQPWVVRPEFTLTGVTDKQLVDQAIQITAAGEKTNALGDSDLSFIFLIDGVAKGVGNSKINLNIDPKAGSMLGAFNLRIIAQDKRPNRPRHEKSIWIQFGDLSKQATLSAPTPFTITTETSIPLSLDKPLAEDLSIRHEFEEVAVIPSGQTKFELPVESLGRGPIRLHGVSTVNGQPVSTMPLTIELL